MFYDITKVLSYNAFLNFLIGERGVGKTYSLTKFFIKQFINKGYQFAYIRRFKSELKDDVPTFFDSMIQNKEFEGHQLSVKGNKFYIDDKVAGFAMTLTTAQNKKGSNFPNVQYIMFDEFIIEDDMHYYLNNEVMSFLGLIESIARLRDIRVFLLGNAGTFINPYFSFFNLSLPYNSDIKVYKQGTILINYMKNEKYREYKKQTKFGILTSDTPYSEYAIDNKFKDDNRDFIEKKTGSSKCVFGFKYKNNIYGVWNDYDVGKIFVSNDNNSSLVFATTKDDMTPNTMLISYAKQFNVWKNFIQNYKLGNVYYENVKIKLAVADILRFMIR